MVEVGHTSPIVTTGANGQAGPSVIAPDVQVDRTLRCRYELKYTISPAKAEAIEQYVKPYMTLDRYSKLQPDGYYPIVSLYLDSTDLQLCWETLTGHKNRFKLRIRGYSDDQQYPLFFEIKRRVNTVIVKGRAKVKHQDLARALRGLPVRIQTDQDVLDQFQLYVNMVGAGPMALIRYQRKAFEAKADSQVRVTFDRQLCYKVTREPLVYLSGTGWQHNYVTMECVILEIKFTGCYPGWLNSLVRDLDLPLQSVSKYATSIQQACALGFCAPRLGD